MDELMAKLREGDEAVKRLAPGEKAYVWAVVTNSDLTEGRGRRVVIRDEVYGSEGMARYAGRQRGVMGTPADAQAFLAVKDTDGNLWLLCDDGGNKVPPSKFVEVSDDAHEKWTMETKKRALSKLTPEERSVLGIPVKGWRG